MNIVVDDSARTPRLDFLDRMEFWAAHLWHVTKGPLGKDCDELIEATFNLSLESIEQFYMQELGNEIQWPYFSFPLKSGVDIELEYANFPEDYQVEIWLRNKEFGPGICVLARWEVAGYCPYFVGPKC